MLIPCLAFSMKRSMSSRSAMHVFDIFVVVRLLRAARVCISRIRLTKWWTYGMMRERWVRRPIVDSIVLSRLDGLR